MYHLRLKGDHYQMGVKRGNIFQKAHISFPLQLDNTLHFLDVVYGLLYV